jgi:hypothetical protein
MVYGNGRWVVVGRNVRCAVVGVEGVMCLVRLEVDGVMYFVLCAT